MNINEILSGTANNFDLATINQQEVLDQMKEKKIFDLNKNEKTNLINFLCDVADPELSVDYLFHVLDTEISYPIDDEKVKELFSSDKMRNLKDLMMSKLQDDEVEVTESDENESDEEE